MPKHITPRGTLVGYHPIIIRFTHEQMADLEKMAKQSGDSISGFVRTAMQRRIDDFRQISVVRNNA
jgi:hypothetical protein